MFKNMRRLLVVCGLFVGTSLIAYHPMDWSQLRRPCGRERKVIPMSKGEISHNPSDWWQVAWTGVGELREMTVSNFGTIGMFPRPAGWEYWDGQHAYNYGGWDPMPLGWSGEYPAGSRQFYIFSAGLWVGGLYPVIFDEDTVEWEPRVATTAYWSDLGAMSVPEMKDGGEMGSLYDWGLYFSTQRIPTGFGFPNEGSHLFAPPGTDKPDWQVFWPFADSASINPRRRAAGFPHLLLDPAKGDKVSMEDTYAVFGDWLPEEEAQFIWIRGYDVAGLGVRIEQRSYTWNFAYNNAYLYFNYKITNMNDFRLDSVYLGFFIDGDVGAYDDDLIGFDRALNLGYTYDSDATEEGWITAAGGVGAVLLDTPHDLGLTGFTTWLSGDPIDDEAQDERKYRRGLQDTRFMTFDEPKDVRQLSNTGPFTLEPGEEVEITIAVVAGVTIADLKRHTENAISQFNLGYLGPQPPTGPDFTLTPGDRKVTITWDNRAEFSVDPATGEYDFEGYRVYRSRTGIAGSWVMLAEFDIADSQFDNIVCVTYAKGTSTAEISFEGFEDEGSAEFEERFQDAEYLIMFATEDIFTVYNATAEEPYLYNPNALEEGTGFFIVDSIGGIPDSINPGYSSGYYIYMDGFYIRITDGVDDPPRLPHPEAGDLFSIRTFKSGDIGSQLGVRYYYVDVDELDAEDNLILNNGERWFYAVTAFDRGDRINDIPPLESGIVAQSTIPRSDPVDWQRPSITVERRGYGIGDGEISAEVLQIDLVKDMTYTLTFYPSERDFGYAEYWRLEGEGDTVLLDSMPYMRGEQSADLIDGLLFTVETAELPEIDTVYWRTGDPSYRFDASWLADDDREPFDFEIIVGDSMLDAMPRPRWVPFKLMNATLDTPVAGVMWSGALDSIRDGDAITILNYDWERGESAQSVMNLTVVLDEVTDTIYPSIADTFRITVQKPFTEADSFSITTTELTRKAEFPLDNIKVVPNPYYVRAPWDRARYHQKIYFQNLPSAATIRIFNAAGLLIRTIEHEDSLEKGGSAYWDLLTGEKMRIMSGLYIYQVITPEGETHVGKFAVIM